MAKKCVLCGKPPHHGFTCDQLASFEATRLDAEDRRRSAQMRTSKPTDGDQTEYRVREVTRYIVTRHDQSTKGGGPLVQSTRELGEFTSYDSAYNVAYALARSEAIELGCAPDDDRVVFPKPLTHAGSKDAVS